MYEDIIKTNKSIEEKINFINKSISIKELSRSIEEIDGELNNPNIWNNPSKAKNLTKSRTKLSEQIEFVNFFNKKFVDLKEAIDLAQDPELAEIVKADSNELLNKLEEFELKLLLKEKEDSMDAILTITAGSGGNESEDWTSMLFRMYSMWAKKNNFSLSIESIHETSVGLNDITVKISGPNAFGFLKNENGVHRLVRNSPFDADFARHTSFAAVEVIPDVDDSIEITINEKDCEIQAIRASGSGGQNVNKVSSCIRLKHIPTGIQIVSRSERDQLANKKAAFERLKAKLYSIEMDKRNKALEAYNSSKSDASFGHQIRSYILSPYKMINDHRSDLKISNAEDFLNGNINQAIKANLSK